MRRSWARASAASRSAKSKGSSVVVAPEEGEEEGTSSSRDLDGLLFFLHRDGVVVKVRVIEG